MSADDLLVLAPVILLGGVAMAAVVLGTVWTVAVVLS
jgi:hypothetical protein